MPAPLDSELMRTFLAVADNGSVTAAADLVGRTQSAVSMQLRRLEESVGHPLFRRLPRGVDLTPRGLQLIPYARRVVGLLDAATTALRTLPLTGPVRIGIPQEYCETILPRVLAAFGARHPEVEVSVRCDFSIPQLAALEAGELDLAVVFASQPVHSGEVLRVDPTVWVTSSDHGLHLQRPLPIAAYFRSDWCRDYMLASLDRFGIPYRISFECDTTGGFWSALRSGLAVVALSRSTVPPGCRELTAADGFPIIDYSAIVLHKSLRGSSPAIDALAEMIREAFRPPGLTEGVAA